MKNTNKKGFTLVELIVVIAILAVLMMLIVPSITGYLQRSKDAVANANAKTCYNAYMSAATMVESGLDDADTLAEFNVLAKELGADIKEDGLGCGLLPVMADVPGVEDITGATWTDGDLEGEFKAQ